MHTKVTYFHLLYFKYVPPLKYFTLLKYSSSVKSFLVTFLMLPLIYSLTLREVIIRKKKVFSQLGGGSSQKFDIFITFFFACSNSSKSAIEFFCNGVRGTPWPIYFENLDDYQLNIDFFQIFFGFSRENFSYFAHNGFQVIK